MKKILYALSFGLSLALAATSCDMPAEPVNNASHVTTSNPAIGATKLFTANGCTLYRFPDGDRFIYWSDCRGTVTETHTETRGKSSVRVTTQSLTTK